MRGRASTAVVMRVQWHAREGSMARCHGRTGEAGVGFGVRRKVQLGRALVGQEGGKEGRVALGHSWAEGEGRRGGPV